MKFIQRLKAHRDKTRLGDLLIHRGYITEAQLQAALEEQENSNLRLGECLIDMGYVSRFDIWWAVKRQMIIRVAFAIFTFFSAAFMPATAVAVSAQPAATATQSARITIRIPARAEITRAAEEASQVNGVEQASVCMIDGSSSSVHIDATHASATSSSGQNVNLNVSTPGQIHTSKTSAQCDTDNLVKVSVDPSQLPELEGDTIAGNVSIKIRPE